MSNYDDYHSARKEAEWLTLRVKFYTLVVGVTALNLAFTILITFLGIFVAPEALLAFFFVILLAMVSCFAYAEYGQEFHMERIVRRKNEEEEREMSLNEAERIVNEFGKGK